MCKPGAERADYDEATWGRTAFTLRSPRRSRQWADDVEALSGLTGWISEAAESTDASAQRRAMEASLGLMELLTGNPDRLETVQDTGVTVEQANEEKVDGSAFTLLNPERAASLADVATTYLFDLSLPGPVDGGMDGSSVFEVFSNSDSSDRDLLQVDLQSRQKFFSLLMADDASATHLYSTVNHLEAARVHPLMGEDGAMESAGSQRGTLRGLFDSALRLETLHRTGQDLKGQGDTQMRDRVFGDARTAAFAATGPYPLSLSIDDVRAHDERLVAEDGESAIGYEEFSRLAWNLDSRSDSSP